MTKQEKYIKSALTKGYKVVTENGIIYSLNGIVKQLSQYYNVSTSTISEIANNKKYNLKEDYN